MDPIEIAKAAAILILGGWAGYKEIIDRRKRKHEAELTERFGLTDNPERCREEKAMRAVLQFDVGQLKVDCAVMRSDIGNMKEDISDIRRKLNGK
jgi:hypothetical protein